MENTKVQQQGKATEKICPCCGAKMTLHWHRLNIGLVNVLIKFKKRVVAKNQNEVHISELDLNSSEFCNFQKLRYHAMIAKCRDKQGKRIGHLWLLTKRGNHFLKGLIEVPEKVGTFRNKIRKKSTNFISIGSVLGNQNMPIWDSIENMEFDLYDITDIEEDLWDIDGQGIINFNKQSII